MVMAILYCISTFAVVVDLSPFTLLSFYML